MSREIEIQEQPEKRKSVELDLKKIAKSLDTTAELLRGKNRRWEISAKRAKAVVELVHKQGHRVGEVAKHFRRDQAAINMMLLRASKREEL